MVRPGTPFICASHAWLQTDLLLAFCATFRRISRLSFTRVVSSSDLHCVVCPSHVQDYSNDYCLTTFTMEQAKRMRCALMGYRAGIYTNHAERQYRSRRLGQCRGTASRPYQHLTATTSAVSCADLRLQALWTKLDLRRCHRPGLCQPRQRSQRKLVLESAWMQTSSFPRRRYEHFLMDVLRRSVRMRRTFATPEHCSTAFTSWNATTCGPCQRDHVLASTHPRCVRELFWLRLIPQVHQNVLRLSRWRLRRLWF